MEQEPLKATHMGSIKIGDAELPCAVLEDGTRVISERGVTKALGGKRGGSHWRRKKEATDGAFLPVYLSANNIKSFIDEDLMAALNSPVIYKPKTGGRAHGLKAELLPHVLDVWLKAHDGQATIPSQQHIVDAAYILMRGLARIGIVALVDEATGYQTERDRNELEKLLAVYLSEERLRWAKTFPDEFYRQIYRLKGWQYPTVGTQRTPYIGKITNQIVYEKLPPGVMDKLKEKNPVVPETKRRRWKNFQFLSEDIGQPDLRNHLLQVIAIMRASTNWAIFKRLFARAFPEVDGHQIDLPGVFDDDEDVFEAEIVGRGI